MTWIDLSVPLRTAMPVYPGDPEVDISRALTVATDGANVLRLSIGSHSGTHVDAPFHVNDAWEVLDALPMARFSGPVELADVRGAGPGGRITAALLAGISRASDDTDSEAAPDRILLLHTGFAEHWGTPAYLDHPWLDADAARLIVDRGYRVVGLDALSVDRSSAPGPDSEEDGAQGFPAHQILAGQGCAIVENLTGLDRLAEPLNDGAGVEVFLFPMNIPGADGAPIRAMARVAPAGTPKAPPQRALRRDEVQEAADRLVAAFSATDTETYFSCFSPLATFIFPTEETVLGSRREYRELWEGWVRTGWKVLDCRSSEQEIQLLGTTAIFTHRVQTRLRPGRLDDAVTSDERETIVFTKAEGGEVLAVHEHLSPVAAAN